MSEANDQPVVATPSAGIDAGVAAEAPATTSTTTEDENLSTEGFDRVEIPDDDEGDGAGDGQPGTGDAAGKDKPASPAADEVEVDLGDGTKIKVPRSAQEAFLRQADYTQKTQALAESRRAFETEQAQQLESLKTFRTEHLAIDQSETALSAIDEALAAYRKYTPAQWETTKAENRANYDAHMERYKDLQGMRTITADALDAAKTDLKAKETSHSEKSSAAQAAKLNDDWKATNVVLAKEIPGWGPEKFTKIGQFAMKTFGVSADQLKATADPVAWQMANRLMKAEADVARLTKTQTQAAKAADNAKALEATPPAKPAASAPAAARSLSDKISDDEWLRRRNAELARKGKR